MATQPRKPDLLPRIEGRIQVLRGMKVMIDADLAELYGVPTKRLNEQVKRNAMRFPGDFVFQVTGEEADALRSQIATLKTGRGQHRKYLPYVFTEHGAIMAAMVLNTAHAMEVSVYVVRAFVRLRQAAALHEDLAKRLAELEIKTEHLELSHDAFSRNTRNQLKQVFDALKELMAPPPTPPAPPVAPPPRPIGFLPLEEKKARARAKAKTSGRVSGKRG